MDKLLCFTKEKGNKVHSGVSCNKLPSTSNTLKAHCKLKPPFNNLSKKNLKHAVYRGGNKSKG